MFHNKMHLITSAIQNVSSARDIKAVGINAGQTCPLPLSVHATVNRIRAEEVPGDIKL